MAAWVGAAAALAGLAKQASDKINDDAQASVDKSRASIPKSAGGGYEPTADKLQGVDTTPQDQRLAEIMKKAQSGASTTGDAGIGATPGSEGTMGLSDAVKADAQLKAMDASGGGTDRPTIGSAESAMPVGGTAQGGTPKTPATGGSDTQGYVQAASGLLGSILNSSSPGTPQAQLPQANPTPYTPTANAAMQAQGQGLGNQSLQQIMAKYGSNGGATI